LIATTVAPPNHKARLLSFWNSSFHTHAALYFPTKGFKNEELESWLNRTSFWVWVRYHCPSPLHLAFGFTTLCRNDLQTPTLCPFISMLYLHLVILSVLLFYDFAVRRGCNSNAFKDH
jgi:hypothetical protein